MTPGRSMFTHHDDGTPESAWQQAALHLLPLAPEPDAGQQILVIAAHPDDETLGAGGLIAKAAARGARIAIVIATDGERSHPDSPTWRREDLARTRHAEAHHALAALAPAASRHAAIGTCTKPDSGEVESHACFSSKSA